MKLNMCEMNLCMRMSQIQKGCRSFYLNRNIKYHKAKHLLFFPSTKMFFSEVLKSVQLEIEEVFCMVLGGKQKQVLRVKKAQQRKGRMLTPLRIASEDLKHQAPFCCRLHPLLI